MAGNDLLTKQQQRQVSLSLQVSFVSVVKLTKCSAAPRRLVFTSGGVTAQLSVTLRVHNVSTSRLELKPTTPI